MDQRQKFYAVGAAGAAGMLCLLLMVLGVIPGTVVASPPGPPAGGCTKQVHYYAEDAPVGSNFFGPAVTGDAAAAQAELLQRRCSDPALVVSHAHYEGLGGFAELSGDSQFAAKVQELAANPQLWIDTIRQLRSNEVQNDGIVTMSGSYQTQYMMTREGDVPLIRQASPDRPSFEVIRFTLQDGTQVNFKLDCGFQPVIQGEFPGIPPLTQAPPPVVSTPPTVPPGTVPPTTVPTTKPTVDFDCGQNGIGCPPGVDPNWVQPVQENSSGAPVGPTSGYVPPAGGGNPSPPTTVTPPVTVAPPATRPPTTDSPPTTSIAAPR